MRPIILQRILSPLLLLLVLLLADFICYQQTLPIEIVTAGETSLHVGSQTLPLGMIGTPQSLLFEQHEATVHEYQIDGTDSTNNFSLDTNYLTSIASSPYYRFQAWMRNLDGTSHWSDLHVSLDGHVVTSTDWPANGTALALPAGSAQSVLRIQFQLRRPETPMSFDLMTSGNTVFRVTLNRNDRKITVTGAGKSGVIANAFFPVDSIPFAAMVLDTLLRTAICAIVILLLVFLCEIGIVAAGRLWESSTQAEESDQTISQPAEGDALVEGEGPQKHQRHRSWHSLTAALHPVALVMLAGSFCFVAWIAREQYQAEPHIYDASAYLFAAKMYASWHLSVPIPPADRFPGPFMVQFDGQWFGQYGPGTALSLVPGIWLGVPWLVEPLLGTFTLLAIGLLAARLFDRRTATLAVVLGAFSPFYSYLAASYLSHAVALFYLTWGLWALVRFAQGGAGWNLPLAAVFFGMGGLTRDLVALLFVITVLSGVIWLSWQQLRTNWQRWVIPGILFLVVVCLFVLSYLGFNALLTHDPWTTPRSLLFAGDHWGFGQGVGFYGQHTPAAGLVNLDELLTILEIDLYGWPFYFTLAFLLLPFLTRRATTVDWFCLAALVLLTGAYVGYFYHGIYLGPRYLFETLPFLLTLTARGILTLADASRKIAQALHAKKGIQETAHLSIPTIALVIVLFAFNLLYFFPRQIQLHQNYSGLPTSYHINLAQIYHPPFHNAIVITSDYTVYQMVMFALNDPYLRNDVIYAWGSTVSDDIQLQKAFPGRNLYQMSIDSDGSIQYTLLVLR